MNGPEKLIARQIARELREQCSVSNRVVESGEYESRVRWRNLRRTSVRIAEIAAATGFADQSHLTRPTTATVGLSPAACRREARR